MPKEKKVNCEDCQDTGVYDYHGFSVDICISCNDNLTVKQDLTVEPVSNRYKLGQPCGGCGGMPGDWAFDPWESLPWIVTLSESGNWRFLIDRRDAVNRDMFSGFKIDGHGSIGDGISQMSGNGGRINLHRSYFIEDLPE
jgi:hypothetical protein